MKWCDFIIWGGMFLCWAAFLFLIGKGYGFWGVAWRYTVITFAIMTPAAGLWAKYSGILDLIMPIVKNPDACIAAGEQWNDNVKSTAKEGWHMGKLMLKNKMEVYKNGIVKIFRNTKVDKRDNEAD